MLEVKRLTCGYRRNAPVLHDLSLTASPGKITVVLGRNGCGKSTLLHTVMGEIPFEGEILLGTRPLRELTPRERAKRISLLPQHLPAHRRGCSLAQELPALPVRWLLTCRWSGLVQG